jgi:hypothetical protein
MALSTLDRAKNAATQGRRASLRNPSGVDMAALQGKEREGKGGSSRAIGDNRPTSPTVVERGLSGRVAERAMSGRIVDDTPGLMERRMSTGTRKTGAPSRATFTSIRDLRNNHEEGVSAARRPSRSVSPAPEGRRPAALTSALTSAVASLESASADAMNALDNDDTDDINKSKRPLFKARELSSFGIHLPPMVEKQASLKVLLVDVADCFL